MWWFQQGLCILPVALVLWTAATFYQWLWYYGRQPRSTSGSGIMDGSHVHLRLRHGCGAETWTHWCHTSGTVAPERCVFGIMLDMSAFLGVATMYVRYKQVQALTDEEESKLHKLNVLGLVLGWTSSFGMCIVANFQVPIDLKPLFSMHLVGAILTFGVGALYILVQTLVSLYMQPHVHGKSIFWVRLSIGVWTFASIISMFVPSVIMYSSLPGVDVAHKLHWIPGETGYIPHIISTISEWSLALSFISFFLSYIRDFQKITLRAEADLQSNHMNDSPHYSVTTPVNQSETSPLLAGGI